MSLPSWERGLKSNPNVYYGCGCNVAPLVGAWIEMMNQRRLKRIHMSLPSWERGLKFNRTRINVNVACVAPLVGAWIEIIYRRNMTVERFRRSPRGSVD